MVCHALLTCLPMAVLLLLAAVSPSPSVLAATPPPLPAALTKTFMQRAIELAQAVPSAPFGAVIVNMSAPTPYIVAEGVNAGGGDPTRHGEMEAITHLALFLNRSDSTVVAAGPQLALLTTAEPCSMCMSAILWSHFAAVYYGADVPFLAKHGWAQIDLRAAAVIDAAGPGMPQHVMLKGGILQDDCEALYAGGPPKQPPVVA